MKERHHKALTEIQDKFKELEEVQDPDSGFQIGWSVNLGDEKISFNFTSDGLRIFAVEKCTEKSKYKGFEPLRHCVKKAGLEQLVYYGFEEAHEFGRVNLEIERSQAAESGDGLLEIEKYYKVHSIESTDEQGGGLRRIGSFRR